MAEPDGVYRFALVLELERQVFFTHQALRDHFDLFAEGGGGKALAPDGFVQGVHQIHTPVSGQERAVGGQAALQGGGV